MHDSWPGVAELYAGNQTGNAASKIILLFSKVRGQPFHCTAGQIDNSVSVSCDVAAVTRFFCPGFNGCASKVAQNISNKPYLTLPYLV